MKLFTLKSLFAFILSAFIVHSHAGSVVVVGASSPIGKSTQGDVVKVFLGKKKDLAGVSVVPIDQDDGTPARTAFYSNTVKKSDAQLKSYWSRLIFTGKGQAPQVVGADEDVKGMVASNPNLIGYIDAASVDGSVKVIYQP